jgi:hypothetical protein
MALEDQQVPGTALKGEGASDAAHIQRNSTFFRTNGVWHRDGATLKIEGKKFLAKAPAPVVAIHSANLLRSTNLIEKIFVQTATKLYMVDALTDALT